MPKRPDVDELYSACLRAQTEAAGKGLRKASVPTDFHPYFPSAEEKDAVDAVAARLRVDGIILEQKEMSVGFGGGEKTGAEYRLVALGLFLTW